MSMKVTHGYHARRKPRSCHWHERIQSVAPVAKAQLLWSHKRTKDPFQEPATKHKILWHQCTTRNDHWEAYVEATRQPRHAEQPHRQDSTTRARLCALTVPALTSQHRHYPDNQCPMPKHHCAAYGEAPPCIWVCSYSIWT